MKKQFSTEEKEQNFNIYKNSRKLRELELRIVELEQLFQEYFKEYPKND